MGDLYQSENWKSLDKVSRAQLLLVIEGLKRGTIIEGNWTSFMDVIKKTGLEYKLNTDNYSLYPVFNVAAPGVLGEASYRFLTLPDKLQGGEYHRINGWMLSYPECCTDEYVKKISPDEKVSRVNGQRHMSYRFGRELTELIRSEWDYPDVFDYTPPSFTPCSVNCVEARAVLRSWKEAINILDPEAAKELVYFNRHSYPQVLVHQRYLREERNQRKLDYKIQKLRRSAE